MNNLTKTKLGGGKTFKRFLALFLILLGCATTGAWAQETMTIDFEESDFSTYTDWTITNLTRANTISAKAGSYYGSNGSKTTASITTKNAIASPVSLTFYISKSTTNTNAGSIWIVETSSDGSNWTTVGDEQSAASEITKGSWTEVTRDLNNYENVYVRIRYNGTNAARCIDEVVLTYAAAGPAKEVTSIAISGTPKTTYYVGDTPSAEGLVVTATYDDGETGELKSNLAWTFNPESFDAAGTTHVTATVVYDNNESLKASTDFDVTVEKGIANTEETAYTVEEAVALIDKINDNDKLAGYEVFVKGIISEVGTFNSKYGSLTYYISTDGTTANQFMCYSGLNIGGVKFTAASDVEVGASVIVKGKLKDYNGTKELDTNNELVSYKVSTEPSIIAADVEYAAEATSGEIAYSIKNPVDGVTLSTSSTTGWISNVVVAADKVTFDMTENTEATPREGTITLTYTGAEDKIVTVTQLGAKEKYTVTLADDASTLTESVGGEGVTLPTRADVTPYTFMGWAAAELTDETTTEPTVFSGAYNPESNITLYPVYVRTEGSGAKETTVSTTIADYASANSWENSTQYSSITLNDNVTATAAGGGNTGKYYTNGNNWRLYSTENATLSISANGGATLKSVALTYTDDGTMSYNGTNIESDVAVPVTGTEAIFNVASGQGRITTISVTYTVNSGTSYYTSHPATATITLSEACTDGTKYYGTFSSKSAFIVPEGLTVSRVYVENGKLQVYEYETGAVVPKDFGVMVSSATAGEHTVKLTTEESVKILNMLRSSGNGITAAEMTTNDANCKFYRLTMHRGTQLGFFWGAENGAGFDIEEGKAYLAVPEANAANIQGFTFDNTETGISAVEGNTNGKQPIYNLQGQRVGKAVKGIYIVNGKKVIIK